MSDQYDFSGSTVVMVLVFAGVFALRYFGVFTISWWLLVPTAIVTAVIVTAIISTVLASRR